MWLTIGLFGRELFSFHVAFDSSQVEHDEPGDNLSNPVGFVANLERPDESGLPYNVGWE